MLECCLASGECRARGRIGPVGPSSTLSRSDFARAKPEWIPETCGMVEPRTIRNLALIGFMGTGKSCVGRIVADSLHFTFLDTDHVIEARAGKPIKDIFAQDGEPAFREWEARIVEEIAHRTRTVISTGGGLPTREGNLRSLKSHALVICLWAGPEAIYERVRDHSHRPLLNDPDPLHKIRELLAVRESYYRQADVLVNTEMRSPREVALQVLHNFQMAQAAHP
jgi:shikimate kinase